VVTTLASTRKFTRLFVKAIQIDLTNTTVLAYMILQIVEHTYYEEPILSLDISANLLHIFTEFDCIMPK
jgi:hypothetical protein